EPVGARVGEAVAPRVLARERERCTRAVQREHRPRASGKRVEREAPRVTEAVEHIASGGERTDAIAVCALVEVEAGLLPAHAVDAVTEAVLDDPDGRSGEPAAEDAAARRQALQRADVEIRSLVRGPAPRFREPRVDDELTPPIGARRGELKHSEVGIV